MKINRNFDKSFLVPMFCLVAVLSAEYSQEATNSLNGIVHSISQKNKKQKRRLLRSSKDKPILPKYGGGATLLQDVPSVPKAIQLKAPLLEPDKVSSPPHATVIEIFGPEPVDTTTEELNTAVEAAGVPSKDELTIEEFLNRIVSQNAKLI